MQQAYIEALRHSQLAAGFSEHRIPRWRCTGKAFHPAVWADPHPEGYPVRAADPHCGY